MTLSLFGFLLIIGCLAARDEMLAAAQRKEFRRLRDAWTKATVPLPRYRRFRPRPSPVGCAPRPCVPHLRPPVRPSPEESGKSSGGSRS